MKVSFHEYDYAFSIDLEGETQEDAAWLTRWKLNAKAAPVVIHISAGRDGKFNGYCSWQKRGDFTAEIKRR